MSANSQFIVTPKPQYIRTHCGYAGSRISYTLGSFWLEVFLWLFFIVPSIIYSTLRLTARKFICPNCKNSYDSCDSHIGKNLLKDLNKNDDS